MYVLIEYDQLWKYCLIEKTWIKVELQKILPGIEPGFSGGVYDEKNTTWFFKGYFSYIQIFLKLKMKKHNFKRDESLGV